MEFADMKYLMATNLGTIRCFGELLETEVTSAVTHLSSSVSFCSHDATAAELW